MTTICGPITRRPNDVEVDQYVCACGLCCATLTSDLTAKQEAHIVSTFDRLHREREKYAAL